MLNALASRRKNPARLKYPPRPKPEGEPARHQRRKQDDTQGQKQNDANRGKKPEAISPDKGPWTKKARRLRNETEAAPPKGR